MSTIRRGGAVLAFAFLIALGSLSAGEQEGLIQSSEIEGRRVIMPPDLPMDLDWYSPVVGPEAGRIVRGWVKDEFVFLQTDLNVLIGIRRDDGTELWRAVLDDEVRYEPSVSRINVLINVRNFLIAIEKRGGQIRWRMLPDFVMSNAPLLMDPPSYPRDYEKDWQNLESIYVGSWHGRLHALLSRARMRTYFKGDDPENSLMAPEFDLYDNWHKTIKTRARITTPVRSYDQLLYFAADDKNVYAVSRDAELQSPYTLQDEPSTALTVTPQNVLVGAHDYYVYALDRLTLGKKWNYAAGALPVGVIYSDDSENMVFVATEADGVHAVRVTPASGGGRGAVVTPESHEFAYKVAEADGTAGAGEHLVYLGYDPTPGFRGYYKVAAVHKQKGNVAWKTEAQGVRFFLEFHNMWRRSDQEMRLYAVTEDNRLLSFKERTAKAGPVKEKKEPAPAPPPPPPAEPKAEGGE